MVSIIVSFFPIKNKEYIIIILESPNLKFAGKKGMGGSILSKIDKINIIDSIRPKNAIFLVLKLRLVKGITPESFIC